MKKVIRLTESDLVRLINRVISEQSTEGEIESMPFFLKALEKFPVPSQFIKYFLFDIDHGKFESIMTYPPQRLFGLFKERGIKDVNDLKIQKTKLENYGSTLEKAYNNLQNKGEALSYLKGKKFDSNSKPEKLLSYRTERLMEKIDLVLKSFPPGPSNPPGPPKPSTPPRPSRPSTPTTGPSKPTNPMTKPRT